MGCHDVVLRFIRDFVTRHTLVPLRRCQSIIDEIVHLLSVLYLFIVRVLITLGDWVCQ